MWQVTSGGGGVCLAGIDGSCAVLATRGDVSLQANQLGRGGLVAEVIDGNAVVHLAPEVGLHVVSAMI